MNNITLLRPDDWHCHLRDGTCLQRTVPDQARQFARAIVMPNLVPPLLTVAHVAAYRDAILAHVPESLRFEPLMTLYLNDTLTVAELQHAQASGWVFAVKLYPQGVTTHSEAGVSSLKQIYPLLEEMQSLDMVLAVHGETSNLETDIFDRESVFLIESLQPILWDFPRLRVVLEHVSTRKAVDFVRHGPKTLAATITPHHLLLNRNDLLSGGLKPHHYCLPIVKTKTDQAALVTAAVSGHPRFFLGTDSAPHVVSQKESACGCAGIYSAHAAIELYAEVFSQHNAMSALNDFASIFGADFYRLPHNSESIELCRQPWRVPECLDFAGEKLVPFYAGRELQWKRVEHD